MLLVKQELFTLPGHPSSHPVFSGVCVAPSLVLCVVFCRSLIVFCPFSFGQCVVCCLSFLDLRLPITPLVSSNYILLIYFKFVIVCTIRKKETYDFVNLLIEIIIMLYW